MYHRIFNLFFGQEFYADSVKRIKVYGSGEEFYIVSLIEHKSDVDYDVCMQLLRYMVCIWWEYAKKAGNRSHNKDFRYPPIIPIVYYEGINGWSVAPNLQARISKNELLSEYLPEMKYIMVSPKAISHEELLVRQNAMVLVMLLNRIQQKSDIKEFAEKVGTGDMGVLFKPLRESVEKERQHMMELEATIIEKDEALKAAKETIAGQIAEGVGNSVEEAQKIVEKYWAI